jgi:hypothetical protein
LRKGTIEQKKEGLKALSLPVRPILPFLAPFVSYINQQSIYYNGLLALSSYFKVISAVFGVCLLEKYTKT